MSIAFTPAFISHNHVIYEIVTSSHISISEVLPGSTTKNFRYKFGTWTIGVKSLQMWMNDDTQTVRIQINAPASHVLTMEQITTRNGGEPEQTKFTTNNLVDMPLPSRPLNIVFPSAAVYDTEGTPIEITVTNKSLANHQVDINLEILYLHPLLEDELAQLTEASKQALPHIF